MTPDRPGGRGGRGRRRTGTILDFDEHAGYGHVQGEDGTVLFFHCTAIADGSRTIPAGAAVTFDVVAGHNGRWEAAAVDVIRIY